MDYDLAIFGSGFGGSLMGMIAQRLGLSVLLIERGAHPRFAIGESTSPLANLLIEELSARYDLPALLPLSSYGPWQRAYPDVGCGLKRGFTFYAHQAGEAYRAQPSHETELMVSASPADEVADTHWFRADVDHFLVKQAIETGVEYRDRSQVTMLERTEGGWEISGERAGSPFRVSARLLIDATGPRGILHRLLRLPEADFADYPPTQTLYSHFTGVKRCEEIEAFRPIGTPPYPPDDAALHHVFEGGWMWVLRFNNGITSAGFAVTDDLAKELGLPGDPDAAWQRFLERYPSIGEQFSEAALVRPFVYAPRLSFRAQTAVGDGWAMLPSAAAFIDPLFSTGIALTLLGIERLSRILAEHWEQPTLCQHLREYGEITLAEADGTALYIGSCYHSMPTFRLFAPMTMFYFAAASYSEMARRLEKRHLVRRFLAHDHPAIVNGVNRCRTLLTHKPARKLDSDARIESEVRHSIEGINIAGLCNVEKRNWYPVDLEDLVRGARKLEMTPEQMRQVIATAPWARF